MARLAAKLRRRKGLSDDIEQAGGMEMEMDERNNGSGQSGDTGRGR
jgi:hypothetical protein